MTCPSGSAKGKKWPVSQTIAQCVLERGIHAAPEFGVQGSRPGPVSLGEAPADSPSGGGGGGQPGLLLHPIEVTLQGHRVGGLRLNPEAGACSAPNSSPRF